MLGDTSVLTPLPVRVKVPNVKPPNPAWSYVAHLPDKGDRTPHWNITDDHQIVLYHYVTRSQQEFVERKLTHTNLGAYSADFADAVGDNSTVPVAEHPDLDRLYAAFERKHGFDGRHIECAQGVRIAEEMNRARDARGWDAFSKTFGTDG